MSKYYKTEDVDLVCIKNFANGDVLNAIRSLPTIEVSEDCISRAEGVWINKHEWENGFFERECSVCGAMKPILMHTAKINYCPNCGAKMKGEEE